ncbi:MAG: hypothetical protein OXE78_07085 [Gammaproteobacteria bacterium]|nr:hypothetical protein [Gammaproteobacteria bacterium]MCY4356418.1 hypothetical protein [Gammaproteobacteria bacterium]
MSKIESSQQAAHHFLLNVGEARSIFAHLTKTIEDNQGATCVELELSELAKNLMGQIIFES